MEKCIVFTAICSIFWIICTFVYVNYENPFIFFQKSNRGLLFQNDSPSRHWSRVAVLYLPYVKSSTYKYVAETYSFLESWKSIMEKNPIRNITDPHKPPEYIRDQTNNETYFPWFEYQRARLHDVKFPYLENLIPDMEIPDGPPLITDVLIIASPHVNQENSMHKDCRYLDSNLKFEEIRNIMNVTGRLKAAKIELANYNQTDNESIRTQALLGDSRCFLMKEYIPSCEEDNTFMHHPQMFSIGFLTGEKTSNIIFSYDIVLRSDNDCYLTPFFHDRNTIPWFIKNNFTEKKQMAFLTGQGGYGGDKQNKILKTHANYLNLRYQDLHNLGSTWYGTPKDVLDAAEFTIQIAKYLMISDPVMENQKGVWPGWYHGVMSLYSSELALNHLFDKSKLVYTPSILDGPNTANSSILSQPYIHLHCWHTMHFFSKHAKQNENLVYDEDMDILKFSWYVAIHWTLGERIRNLTSHYKTDLDDPKLPGFHSLATRITPLEIFNEEAEYLTCPIPYSFPYHGGEFCCASNITCDNTKIHLKAECCEKHDFIVCPFVRGCSNMFDINPEDFPHYLASKKYYQNKFATLKN